MLAMVASASSVGSLWLKIVASQIEGVSQGMFKSATGSTTRGRQLLWSLPIEAEFCRGGVPKRDISAMIQAQTGGRLNRQGLSCSSCAASRNSAASSPNRLENIMPSGRPALLQASGTDIAGWPDMLNIEVQGM
jgi:hypothetical protein